MVGLNLFAVWLNRYNQLDILTICISNFLMAMLSNETKLGIMNKYHRMCISKIVNIKIFAVLKSKVEETFNLNVSFKYTQYYFIHSGINNLRATLYNKLYK